MLTIRPIAPADRAAFAALHGSCSDEAAAELIAASQRAFAASGIGAERQVFVLEDRAVPERAGSLLGAGALAGAIGLELPRFCYRTGVVVHASPELKLFHRAATLVLCNDHTGCAEIVAPLMATADPAEAPARLLVEAMLLYVAEHGDRFAANLVAELPGVRFEGGGSPFWNSLGRHFYAGRPPPEDAFLPAPERSHIARLMPKHPLYSSFLDADARACIGKRAGSARGLADVLHAQGFRHRGHVGVFDGGPVLVAETADLAAGRHSRIAEVEIAAAALGSACLVASAGAGIGGFAAALVQGALVGTTFAVRPDAAEQAGLAAGQRVRVLMQRHPPSALA